MRTLCAAWLLALTAAGADEPLVDLAGSAQRASADNVEFRLNLAGFSTDKRGLPRSVPVTLRCRQGEWSADGATLRAAKLERDQLTTTLVVHSNECTVSATIMPAQAADIPNVTGPGPEGLQFWRTLAEAQGVVGKVQGTYRREGDANPVTGVMQLALRPGRWDMGVFDGGLKLTFNLGHRRENWNHARIAQYELPEPRDLSRFAGLRLRLATDQPRGDVSVSVWLREADGSWYYIKNAVPLVDATNEAVLLFADFAEAEWVAPGNHMDEDYVLDLTTISRLGIGVVNSLGVGPVQFTVQTVDLVERARPAPSPARVAVTGRALAVNGHDVVPAGIFGGYAGDLPQRFRPGCQRQLAAPSYPKVPRQDWVRFTEHNVPNPTALAAALLPHTAGRLQALQEELNRAERKPRPLPLLDGLNRLLRRRDVHDAAAWKDVAVPASLQPSLARVAELNDTELMELNRRLLEAAYPQHIVPAPAYGPTESFHVACFGERFQSAPLLNSPGWRAGFAGYGRQLAANSKAAVYQTHLEFWNEPYLNWAERSRKNYDSKFFVTTNLAEGAPVQVNYSNGPVIPHFKWTADGQGGFKVVDETAFSYWSGAGNEWIYNAMLTPMAQAIKETNPDVRVVAGWGFRWNEDHWAAWDLLYKPTIDKQIQWIDAIHEHHYQGDVTAMPASYEVLVAYGVTQHKKWLHLYNTECNDLVDAPARGAVDTPEKAKRATRYRRMTYNLRDCLYTIAQTPDKAKARTVIHNDGWGASASNGWTAVAYGLMRNLRGRLVETASDDPNVWCVASVDGTDPLALPPPGTPPTLVVCLFNDHRQPRTLELDLAAPAGTEFRDGVIEQALMDWTTFDVRLAEQPVTANGSRHRLAITLPERGAWKIALPLSDSPTLPRAVERSQFFSGDILRSVTRGTNFMTTIRLGAREREAARRAWLRLVVEDVAEGEASVTAAGQDLPVPKALTADNICRIVEVPLVVGQLPGIVPVTFRVNPGNHAGYRVDMASIVLEHPPLPRAIAAPVGHVAPVAAFGRREWFLVALVLALLVVWLARRR